MRCDNCWDDLSWTRESGFRAVGIMRKDDAEHFANFEEGMEDYMPDQLDLCPLCTMMLFEKNWLGLEQRAKR